jgi:hypothetical protein
MLDLFVGINYRACTSDLKSHLATCIILALIAIMLIDTSFVKIYEIIDKDFAPIQSKMLLFSVEALSCLILQFFLLKQVWNSFKSSQLHSRLQVGISIVSLR